MIVEQIWTANAWRNFNYLTGAFVGVDAPTVFPKSVSSDTVAIRTSSVTTVTGPEPIGSGNMHPASKSGTRAS